MAYIAPVHRASSIRHALKANLTAPAAGDLIVARANRLEVWSAHPQQPDQLVLSHSRLIYGKVTLLYTLRPASSPTDHLFVGTDRYHYFTLSWDADLKRLKTEKAFQDIAEKSARDSQTGDRIHVDPTSRFMTLECYEGVVNVLPIAHAGKGKRKAADHEIGELGQPIQVRVPELFVRSSCFVHKRQGNKLPNPEFAMLYEDSQNSMRLVVRELEFEPSLRPQEEPHTANLEKNKEGVGDFELGASHLIPLPAPMYGMLVVGETSISYVDEWEYRLKRTFPLDDATVFVAWCAVDEQRYVLADDYGKLYLVFVKQDDRGDFEELAIDVLGETSRASTLVYLDGGRIFLGSHQGDSQVIQISERSIEVVQSFANIAPILDFTVMDLGNRSADAPVNEYSSGQARIVTGSGAFKDGSLRSVRAGVGLEDLGSIGAMGAPVSAVFSAKSQAATQSSDTVIVSLVGQTRVFHFSDDGDVEEVEQFRGFDLGATTLYAGNLPDGRALQITETAVFLTDADGDMVTDTWTPAEGTSIASVAVEGVKTLLSLGGASLVLLDMSQANIRVLAEQQFESTGQISCIALSKTLPNACIVGFWQGSKVAVLDLTTLKATVEEIVSEDDATAVPRSLAIVQILPNQPPTLFVGLADGNVVTYTVESPEHPFTARKSIILGTQQPKFAVLSRGDGLENVFTTCEQSSLIYGSEGRMVYSAITAENAVSICGFDNAAYPGAIVVATEEDELKLAVVDNERTTHVQTLPVGQTVRRIAYSPDLKAFGLGTIKRTLTAGVEEVISHFQLVDEVAFQELHTYALNEDELVETVMRCKLDDGSGEEVDRFVVGTAYLEEQSENSQTRGRILVFEVTESRQLKLVTELSLRGACRCLAMVEGKIAAALIKTVVTYSFEYQTPSKPFLVKKASYRTATAPIDICVTGNTIAVTDLMKSVSLLSYNPGRDGVPDQLVEIARHFETSWGTAVAHVADHTYLSADAEGNLIVLQHEVNGFSEDDRRRLRVTSEMQLGEMVNRIRRIDVQPTPGAVVIPRAFLATVDGAIYVFALIAPGKQDLLMRLQSKLAEAVESPGHVRFAKFRGFRSSVRDMGEDGPSRFVDGELIERFLDLPEGDQQTIVEGLGLDVVEVRDMVESLRRIH